MIAVMASLMATIAVNAQGPPIGTTHHAETGPEHRVRLQNGVVTPVVRLHGVGAGTWMAWGACTVQDTVMAGIPGYYIYTYTGISLDPHAIPNSPLQYLDSRPYHTGYMDENGRWHANLFWWFAANPPPRVFHFTGDPNIYVNALSWAGTGGIPPLAEVFCGILAVKVANYP